MQTLEKVLADLYKAGTISFEAAVSKTSKPDEVQRLIGSTVPAGGKPGAKAGARGADQHSSGAGAQCSRDRADPPVSPDARRHPGYGHLWRP